MLDDLKTYSFAIFHDFGTQLLCYLWDKLKDYMEIRITKL